MDRPQAILFDLDDTLLDHYACQDPSWEATCRRAAHELGRECALELRAAIRGAARWYWSEPVRAQSGRLNMWQACADILSRAIAELELEAPDGLTETLARSYLEQVQASIELLPGAIETLEHFRRQGAKLALITNGHPELQRPKIERFGLARHFDCILVEGEFGAGKPEEQVFRHVLEQLGVPPSQAWMVGDNLEADITGAKSLGIYAIWRDRTGEGLDAERARWPHLSVMPDRVIRHLQELRDDPQC